MKFKIDHLVTLLVPLIAWVLLTIASLNTSVASLEAGEVEDKRVNNLVYGMNDRLIRIDENLSTVKENQQKAFEILSAGNKTLENKDET